MWCIQKDCEVWQREDWGGHRIVGQNEFVNNPPSGVSASKAAVNNEADSGVEVSNGHKDEASDWDIGC